MSTGCLYLIRYMEIQLCPLMMINCLISVVVKELQKSFKIDWIVGSLHVMLHFIERNCCTQNCNATSVDGGVLSCLRLVPVMMDDMQILWSMQSIQSNERKGFCNNTSTTDNRLMAWFASLVFNEFILTSTINNPFGIHLLHSNNFDILFFVRKSDYRITLPHLILLLNNNIEILVVQISHHIQSLVLAFFYSQPKSCFSHILIKTIIQKLTLALNNNCHLFSSDPGEVTDKQFLCLAIV